MPRSMTGFGQADAGNFHIEIKGVNHRYREIRIKQPRELSAYEIAIRKMVNDSISRGKIDLGISKNLAGQANQGIEINWDAACASHKTILEMSERFGGAADFRDLLLLPGVICEDATDPEELWATVKPGIQKAIESFIEAKTIEGEALREDLANRIRTLQDYYETMTEQAATVVDEHRERLLTRLDTLLGEQAATIDETRLAQEVAIIADKSDITEELVRLKTHLDSFLKVLNNKNEPIGRRLDFMLQEINRELNTIGSKSQKTALSHSVIDSKTEVEKIREQVQNIE